MLHKSKPLFKNTRYLNKYVTEQNINKMDIDIELCLHLEKTV